MFSFYVKPNQVISIRPAHDTRLDTYPGKELSVPYNAECWCLCGSPRWRQWARVPALSAFEVDGWVSDGLFSPDTGGLPLKAAALNVQRSRKKGEEWFSDRATLMNGPVTLATVAAAIVHVSKVSTKFRCDFYIIRRRFLLAPSHSWKHIKHQDAMGI